MGKPTKEITITEGSGNVFADLGFENPEEELEKSILVSAISDAVASKGLSQAAIAKAIGLDQPAVSRLLRGRTAGYTIERLFRILNHLGQSVTITVKPAANAKTKIVIPGAKVSKPKAVASSPRAQVTVRETKATYRKKSD